MLCMQKLQKNIMVSAWYLIYMSTWAFLYMDKVMFLAQETKIALLDPVSVQISNRTVGRWH